MKTFAYRGFEPSGRARRGMIEADDLKEAREKLSTRGIYPESVEPASSGPGTRRPSFRLDVRAVLYRELAALLKAGLPLAAALEVLLESPEDEGAARIMAGVRDRIREGQSLAQALTESSPEVGPFERAVVVAGERSGNLDIVMDQLAGYLDEQQQWRESLRSALVYPAAVVCLSLLVLVGMFGYVVPTMARFLEEGRVALPWLTRALLAVSRHLQTAILPLAVALGLALWLAIRRWRAHPSFRLRAERRLLGLPWFGRGWRLMLGVRFARTLGLLLRGGVPLVEAMELAGASTGSVWVEQAMREQAEAVRHGRSFPQAMRAVPPLAPTLSGWVQAGEASGNLEAMLGRAADRCQLQWTSFVRRSLVVIEPLLIVAVGLFVLLIALAVLLPILSLNQSIG